MLRPVLSAIQRLPRLSRFSLSSHTSASPSSTSAPPGTSLILTEKAVNRLKQITEPHEVLRVTVEGGGCSGFEYKLAIDDKTKPDDEIIQIDGARVAVDKISMEFVKGSTIDFVEEMMRSTFRIVENPHADKGCSCGTSFSIKNM